MNANIGIEPLLDAKDVRRVIKCSLSHVYAGRLKLITFNATNDSIERPKQYLNIFRLE